MLVDDLLTEHAAIKSMVDQVSPLRRRVARAIARAETGMRDEQLDILVGDRSPTILTSAAPYALIPNYSRPLWAVFLHAADAAIAAIEVER